MKALRKGSLAAGSIVAVVGFVLLRDRPPQPDSSVPAAPPAHVVPAFAPGAPPVVPEPAPKSTTLLDAPAAPTAEPPPRWSAEEVAPLDPEPALESVRLAVRQFALRFKGNPVGNNAEITAALNGDNPAGARFLDPAVHRVNEQGEWVDGWGRPYFFHQLSGEQMEIRSAGPDRILWTLDDLVMR